MGRAGDELALVEIVGPDPDTDQSLHEILHHRRRVVDPPEQHALVQHGDSGLCNPDARLSRIFGDLSGVVELRADPKGLELPEHPEQVVGDALRERAGKPGPDPHDLDLIEFTDPREEVLQKTVFVDQRVPSGQEQVPDPRIQ